MIHRTIFGLPFEALSPSTYRFLAPASAHCLQVIVAMNASRRWSIRAQMPAGHWVERSFASRDEAFGMLAVRAA